MKRPERRTFLRNTGLAITAAALSEPLAPAGAQTSNAAPPNQAAEAPNDVTSKLARFIVSARYEDLPDAVRHEAKRTLLNWVGCAIGGSPQETVGNAIAALAPFTGSRQATLFGRVERMDALNAALLNGISSHVLDFDDTHAQTAIHPAAPIAPAILALAEQRPVGGRDLIGALVAGVETECRIDIAVSPSHYEIG
jgi:2-methylcitrate dehydratase PrpD